MWDGKVRRMDYSLRYKEMTMRLTAFMSCIPLTVHQPPVADVTGKCGMRVSVIGGKILLRKEAHCVIFPLARKMYCYKVEWRASNP